MAEEGEKHPEHAHEHHEEHHEPEKEHEHHEEHPEHEKEEHPHEKAHEQHEKKEEHHEKKEEQPSEKRELRDSRISLIIFMLAGAAVALVSSVLHSSGISNWITGFAGIVLLILLAYVMIKLFKRKLKFFYASLFIYLLVWLVVWIFLFNL